MKNLLVLLFIAFLMVVPIAVPQAETVVLDNAVTTTISIEWSVLDSVSAADMDEQVEDFWDWLCRLWRWGAGGSHGY